jgi:hypothetical protein
MVCLQVKFRELTHLTSDALNQNKHRVFSVHYMDSFTILIRQLICLSCHQVEQEVELYRLVYYGGCEPEIRREVGGAIVILSW